MRAAFLAALKHPALLEVAVERTTETEAASGVELHAMVARLQAAPAHVIERLRQVLR